MNLFYFLRNHDGIRTKENQQHYKCSSELELKWQPRVVVKGSLAKIKEHML